MKTDLYSYFPLVIILAVILAGSAALAGAGVPWMDAFMGLFFLVFALFKLLDVPGFVEGFGKYDLLTQQWRAYGYAYPFIELLLGCAWLGGISPGATAIVTLLVMNISVAGVLRALATGMDTRCACLGTLINVPLSTVSLLEDVLMAVMALLQLWMMA